MTRASIRVLPENLVGRIAAGEVVERPASVVKELLENALDAGATTVEITVDEGPTGRITVADNGSGIAAVELPLAVQRHATSKLEAPGDLDAIASLGFRGEGLAAIAAVSRVVVTSRVAGEDVGARLVVEEGGIGSPEPAPRDTGTTVEVRDVFFNTPARRKYLKSTQAELRACSQLVQAYAFAYPETQFRYLVDGKRIADWPSAADRHERLTQVLGASRVKRLIPVDIESKDLALEGFLGPPEDSRARSAHQVFFVNGRWVQSPLLRQVVRMSYGDLIPPGRHPEAFLMLRLPADRVDVNVHPTKREVRLQDERQLYPRLISALQPFVEDRFPGLRMDRAETPDALPFPDVAASDAPPQLTLYGTPPVAPARPDRVADADQPPGEVLAFPTGEPEEPAALADLWQLHDTYILARVKEGLLIIDQHAAHERVLYEEAMRRLQGENPVSQELLFPTVVELAPDEFSVLLESHSTLEKFGFHLETFGGTSVLVHAIPAGVREWRHGALLRDILDHFADLPGQMDVWEKVARSVACHGAVKAGQALTLREMNELVDQLFATQKPQGDPHGRPVFLRMDLAELHRRFGRSG